MVLCVLGIDADHVLKKRLMLWRSNFFQPPGRLIRVWFCFMCRALSGWGVAYAMAIRQNWVDISTVCPKISTASKLGKGVARTDLLASDNLGTTPSQGGLDCLWFVYSLLLKLKLLGFGEPKASVQWPWTSVRSGLWVVRFAPWKCSRTSQSESWKRPWKRPVAGLVLVLCWYIWVYLS